MVLTIVALGAMSGLFLFFPIDWDSVGNWGYLGVFLVTFVATASFILPIPYLLIVARAGMFLNPLVVTLVAGLAGALGETTGYIIGASGRDLFPQGKLFEKANHWMVTYGFWCVAFFAFVPEPDLRRDRLRGRRAALPDLEVRAGLFPGQVAQVPAGRRVAPGDPLDLHAVPAGLRRLAHALVRAAGLAYPASAAAPRPSTRPRLTHLARARPGWPRIRGCVDASRHVRRDSLRRPRKRCSARYVTKRAVETVRSFYPSMP